MAYNFDGFGNFYEEAPLFSTPLVTYQGVPAGDAQDGDNARLIAQTMDTVAAYRINNVSNSNDLFVDAVTIHEYSGQISGNNQNATLESGEPSHAGNMGGKSVWWQWVAPSSGTVTMDTFGSDFDTLLAVYTGNSVGALAETTSNDDSGNAQSQVSFNAVGGTTYRIAVDGYNGASGNISLTWSIEIPVPSNDDFVAAEVLSNSVGQASGNNQGASKEAGEPNHAGNSGGSSVWWEWAAPFSGSVTMDTFGSGFDTILAVYSGSSVNGLTEVASNDDGGSEVLQSSIFFVASAGMVYRVAVDGFGGSEGSISLNWELTSANPSNDDFANSSNLSGGNGQVFGTNQGASEEAGEPNHAGVNCYNSVWWNWTPPSDGLATFDTFGSGYDTVLAVYVGTSIFDLTEVACNDDSGGLQSKVSFDALSGVNYRIAVDGYGGMEGDVVLNWDLQEFSVGIVWFTSQSDAMAQALAEGKQLLLLAGSSSCGYTQYMKETVCELTSPPIRETILEGYIPWYSDTDASTEWWDYAGGLGTFTLPLICRIDPNNPNIYLDRSTGVQDENEFYDRLRSLGVEPGDVNHLDGVDLEDAILALQTAVGVPSGDVFTDADVNGDSRIGIVDAIYILQKVAQLRQ